MKTDIKTLVSATDLLALQGSAQWPVVLDCGFDLAQPEAGHAAWQQGHVPAAVYMHLDRDLSGPRHDDKGVFRGRHPLPDRAAWAQTLGNCGITPETPVVCCDDQGGPYAARAWWLLRWMGHHNVAVLDGGKRAWTEAGGKLHTDTSAVKHCAAYPAGPTTMPTVLADSVLKQLGALRLIDARAGERFRGEVEPLDAAAGHIPGARNRFFKDNLGPDGRFAPIAELQAAWAPLLRGLNNVHNSVHYCGSGVTACHNILAAAHAGLGIGALYPGSWSEWSSDPTRPQALD
jgi:thiosulfate/3-mercaptopyruvate sulfurtransferase